MLTMFKSSRYRVFTNAKHTSNVHYVARKLLFALTHSSIVCNSLYFSLARRQRVWFLNLHLSIALDSLNRQYTCNNAVLFRKVVLSYR